MNNEHVLNYPLCYNFSPQWKICIWLTSVDQRIRPNNPRFWCNTSFISVNPRFWHCASYFSLNYQRYTKVLALCKLFFKFLSVLYQAFGIVQVIFINAIPRFSAVQELSGFFSHQRYIEVSAVQGSVVQGPSVYCWTHKYCKWI